ncbi:MAG: peptidylprolyl isomerase [Gammaproteobacteria bacterium]|nr:peptidylprolyl isomerase [Gammaproteobacteria bacterium]MDH5777717.1 peptidylprolyl isomerase [Gammaproteobacteria bacterium]
MKTLLTLTLTFFLASGFTGTSFATTKKVIELDQIIAVVNTDIITKTELDRRAFIIRQQFKQKKSSMPPDSVLKKQVLERLILEKIQMQRAERRGIRIGDEDINRVIQNIAKENKLSLQEFRKVLAKDGVPFAEFRDNMKNQMASDRLRKVEVERQVTVTPQEVNNFLSQSAKSGKGKLEYHLRHILIAIPEAATPEQIQLSQKKAEQILTSIKKGADFAQTAIAKSNGQNALQGGDLGWLKTGQLPTVFADIVLQMKPGETSQPIRSSSGYHIIQLEGTRSKNKKHKVKQTLARHILIRTNQLTSDDDAKQKLNKLRKQILAGADFGKLAKSHSDDKGSAIEGGSLGWVNPGMMVKKFDKVMNETKEGVISQPFRTQFGWHILQVMSRRSHDNSQEQERIQAHQQIHQRKVNEATENWFRRIRDEAYVEYRLNN